MNLPAENKPLGWREEAIICILLKVAKWLAADEEVGKEIETLRIHITYEGKKGK